MRRLLLVLTISIGLFVEIGAGTPGKPVTMANKNQPAPLAIPTAGLKQKDRPTLESNPDSIERGSKEKPVWVGGLPARDIFDWIAYGSGLLLLAVGIGGICVAGSTLKKIERQTAATELQARHMVSSERPFIIVETGGDKGKEFWMRNCGKSPAQILFVDPVLKLKFAKWIEERQEFDLPGRPDYGSQYWDDKWVQINVQWLGPGDSKCFAIFEPSVLSMLAEDTRMEISKGYRALFLYSSIKYRGMFAEEIYHSHFCYGWGTLGSYLTGPHGYNKYT